MHRLLLLLVLATSLSGCIKLQMPDNMVSDAIDAMRGSDDASDNDGTTFSHSVVGAADAVEAELKQQCLNELESRAAELLDVDNPTFTVVSESVTVTDDQTIANCTVSLS